MVLKEYGTVTTVQVIEYKSRKKSRKVSKALVTGGFGAKPYISESSRELLRVK